MTRIAIIGYGAMGHEVERLAEPLGMMISGIYDLDRPISSAPPDSFDVAIDFSWPDAAVDNVRAVAALQRPIVVGTTGWYERMDEVRSIVTQAETGCVWGSNFNIGTHLFARIVSNAAELLNNHASFDIMLHEWHHKRKRDSPSGTALTLASTILGALERKTVISTETQHDRIDPHQLHVSSTRGGEVVGRHQVTIDGPYETIDLVHSAKNRAGFAQGALLAAAWIQHRTGMYDVSTVIDSL